MTEREVNNYLLIEKIGSGGMSTVWRGRKKGVHDPAVSEADAPSEGTTADLAIKVIPIEDLDPDFERRLRREPEIHEKLRHENIVALHDWFREGNEFFLVMEFVPGRPLSAVIREDGPMPFEQARDLLRGVLRAVALLHRNDVVHRDIKPGNILISSDNRAVLTDFGIAKFGWQQGETRTQLGLGTPEYMSPEQVRGSGIDHRSDIWSLGVTLFEMLTGRKPFARDTTTPAGYADVISRIMSGAVGDPRRFVADVPDGAVGVIAAATALDPGGRYSSAAAFLGALEVVDPLIVTPLVDDDATVALGEESRATLPGSFASPAPAVAAPSATSTEPPLDEVPKKKGVGGLIAVVLILLAAAIGYAVVEFSKYRSAIEAPSSEGLSQEDADKIAGQMASEYRRHSFDGDVGDLARLYREKGVTFFRLQDIGRAEIEADYRRFFGSIVRTERLDVAVVSAKPRGDSLVETRWRISYEREKEDGTILRGVAEHDYEIAWVDDAWRIRSERLHAIDRDDIAPPQIDTLDLSDSLGGIDIEAPVEETEDAVDEFAPIVRDLSEGEMRSAVRSIVTLLNAGQGDEAWERYASDDLKASVGGFPTMMTDGGISLRSQSFDGNVATVEVVRSDGFGQQEHRLRLTFAEGADPKITKLTVE